MRRRRTHKPLPRTMPVIIRYEGKGRAERSDWHLSDLLAVFPDEAGDVDDPRSMGCYSSIGQHSTCVAGYIGAKTKPATPAQVAAMLNHLRRIGYRSLRAISRASSHHSKARKRQLRGERVRLP